MTPFIKATKKELLTKIMKTNFCDWDNLDRDSSRRI